MTKYDFSPLTSEDVVHAFLYLDGLRDSGVTNMFGAGPYVRSWWISGNCDYVALECQLNPGLCDQKVINILIRTWMRTFDGSSDPETRAAWAIQLEK